MVYVISQVKSLVYLYQFPCLLINLPEFSCSLQDGLEYLLRETPQVFIPLMRFLPQSLISKSFLILLRYSFLIFLSHPFVWWCTFPVFSGTLNYLFSKHSDPFFKGLYNSSHCLSLARFRGCPGGVMVKVMDCGIVVSGFVHFLTNIVGKGMNPLILPAIG